MEWFSAWWQTLDLFSQIMYCVALPATLILLIQTVMIILGFGHSGAGINPSDTSGFDGGADIDTDMSGGDLDGNLDTDMDYSDGSSPGDLGTLNFFTVQGVVTFLCVFGWSGILIYGFTGNIPLALILAFVLGAAAMYGVAKLIWASKKLAHNGTLNVRNMLGASGTVYLVIPAGGEGRGKVNISSGERFVEFDAVTEDHESLPDGTPVRVTDILGDNVLVVEKL